LKPVSPRAVDADYRHRRVQAEHLDPGRCPIPPGDDRRDRAYSIFYLGINIGAFLAPLICGTLAVQYGWHYGFGAAGVGMLVSLAIYLCGRRSLPADDPPRDSLLARENKPLEPGERRALLALIGTCALVTLFWAAFDQQGNTVLLWAEDFNRPVDRPRLLARRNSIALVSRAQSAHDLFAHAADRAALAQQGRRGAEPSRSARWRSAAFASPSPTC